MGCSVVGCERPIKSRGMCLAHYKQWWKHGDPLHRERIVYNSFPTCTVEHCEKPHLSRGYCQNHYALWRRNGAPTKVKAYVGSYIKDGYLYIHVGHRHYEPEHRLVMEYKLGRKLTAEEHVHHKDHNIRNNAPENLELHSRSTHAKIHRAGTWRPKHDPL